MKILNYLKRQKNWRKELKNKFEYKEPNLTEEHIKQIAKFAKVEYKQGDYQKWNKFAQFKWWHKQQQEKGE